MASGFKNLNGLPCQDATKKYEDDIDFLAEFSEEEEEDDDFGDPGYTEYWGSDGLETSPIIMFPIDIDNMPDEL